MPYTGDLFQDIVLESMLRNAQAVQKYWIPGQPQANERARICTMGKGENRKSWAFTPSATVKARQHILNQVLLQQKKKMEPPYSVALKFVLSPDQKDSDVDNLQKCLFDAIFSNKKCIPPMPFKDDKYIQNLVCFKRVGDKPGILLWVMKI
jgi:Holliday junction resolvase RusA-like endonuclease